MAITTSEEEGKIIITLTNGDRQALVDVKNKWKFISYEGIILYVLAVMLKVTNNKLYIDLNGLKNGLAPADYLIKKEDNKTTPAP